MKRLALLVLAGLAAAVPAGQSAWAQEFPTRQITLIAPWPAGGAVDAICRALAQPLSERLGKSVVVENRPGAGGIPGTEAARNAPADGYTLIMCTSGPFGINPAIYSKLLYDPVRDFEPIANLGLTPQAIVVGAQQPWRTLAELVAAAKAKPGEIAYASLGVGTTSHLTMEAFQSAAGIRLNHVPFKGTSDAQAQLLGGNVPMMSDTISGVLAQVKGGKLRALGVAIPQRSRHLPDVPTVAEQGFAGFESVGWIGLCAPAKTPGPVLDRLESGVRAMLADAAVKERLDALAFEPAGQTRGAFAAFMKAEIAKWTQVARAAGAKAD
jgi:tripartite-type tricarboxylate transporter receptor subunit TctC